MTDVRKNNYICPVKDSMYYHSRRVKERENMTLCQYRGSVEHYGHKNLGKVTGLQVDHIIPVTFCFKLGIDPRKASHILNLQHLTKEENVDKWSFVDDISHLKTMCMLWGVDFPSKSMIDEHNEESRKREKYKENLK